MAVSGQLRILREMGCQTLEADCVSFNSAISACGQGKQWELSLLILSELPTVRLLPDVISYNASISACASAP